MTMYEKSYTLMYDIACVKRRNRVVKVLEKSAFRIQHSVFLYYGDSKSVEKLCAEVAKFLDAKADLFCCYQVHTKPVMNVGETWVDRHCFVY